MLKAVHQTIANVGIHQLTGALQLLRTQVRSFAENTAHPFIMNAAGPAGPNDIGLREVHKQIAQRRGVQHTRVVDDSGISGHPSVAKPKLLGLRSQRIEHLQTLCIDLPLVSHEIVVPDSPMTAGLVKRNLALLE